MVNRGRPFCFDHYWSRSCRVAGLLGDRLQQHREQILLGWREQCWNPQGKTILKQKLFTEAEAVNCLVLRCARYCCGCWDFFLCCWWHVQRLSVDLRKQWQFHTLICCPRSGFLCSNKGFLMASIGLSVSKMGNCTPGLKGIEGKTTVLRKSPFNWAVAPEVQISLWTFLIKLFVLGTSPKFALPGRYGDTGRSSKHKKMAVKQFLCQLRCKVGETHDIDTVFKHCVQTLGVRHADSGLKECPGCDLELLGTDSTSNNMSWVSRYIYIYMIIQI